jgi:hypothetical protein
MSQHEAVRFVHDQGFPADMQSRLTQLALGLVQSRLSYAECAQSSLALTGTSQPIDKLHEILTVPADPIASDDSTHDLHSRKKTRPWLPYEDSRLIAGLYRYCTDNWSSVARFVGNQRTRSQCAQRWQRCDDQWTRTEELCLIQLVQLHGEKAWTHVAARLGNRSDVQCRYRYRQLQKERLVPGGGIRKAQSGQIPAVMPHGGIRKAQSAGQFGFQPEPPATAPAMIRPSSSVPTLPPAMPEEDRERESEGLVFNILREDDGQGEEVNMWY